MRPALERASLGQIDLFDQTPATKIAIVKDPSGELPIVMLYCDSVTAVASGGHWLYRVDTDEAVAYFSKDFVISVLDASLYEPMNRRERLKLAHEDAQAYQSIGDELDPAGAELRKAYTDTVRAQVQRLGVGEAPQQPGQYL